LGSLLLVWSALAFFAGPLLAAETKKHDPGWEVVNAIFISDKVTEVAYRLRVVPEAYCARCGWSMVNKELSTVPRLGCYRCASVASVLETAEKHKVEVVLIESGQPSLYKKKWNWAEKFGPPLRDKGYNVHLIDFSEGVPEAILEIGKLLQREEQAAELAAAYTQALQKTMRRIPASKANKKILVLRGVGKRGVQVEAPGGYTDRYLLEPLGCVNVGHLAKEDDTEVSKGHFMLEDWRAVARANPDIIVKLGSPYAIERGLAGAIKTHPELSEVPAVKSRAVYTLPAYYDGSATRYPQILRDWLDAVYQK
jgi:ABC-type Fe3+-hydroxamate transport system substrate-binding protein